MALPAFVNPLAEVQQELRRVERHLATLERSVHKSVAALERAGEERPSVEWCERRTWALHRTTELATALRNMDTAALCERAQCCLASAALRGWGAAALAPPFRAALRGFAAGTARGAAAVVRSEDTALESCMLRAACERFLEHRAGAALRLASDIGAAVLEALSRHRGAGGEEGDAALAAARAAVALDKRCTASLDMLGCRVHDAYVELADARAALGELAAPDDEEERALAAVRSCYAQFFAARFVCSLTRPGRPRTALGGAWRRGAGGP